jgi:SPASM domain peptide maturase of grasp-with-spasm system
MRTDDIYFKVHSNCIPVKGVTRSIICDLQYGRFIPIPNDLLEVITESKIKPIAEIKSYYGFENEKTIDEYMDYLNQHDLLFWGQKEELDNFPDLDLSWDEPCQINNSIIDVDENSNHNFETIFNQLTSLLCKHIQLRFYNPTNLDEISRIVKQVDYLNIHTVDILMNSYPALTIEILQDFVKKNIKVARFFLCSANKTEFIKLGEKGISNIIFVKESIHSCSMCGIINPYFFSINVKTFTEAQKYNTCLNRKISIDVEGNIKNCPSMHQSFGNIKDTSLKEALLKKGFKDLWTITKDQIEGCKDCEFRYICTDCRAYIKDPKNIYSKPVKCQYDPYTASGF